MRNAILGLALLGAVAAGTAAQAASLSSEQATVHPVYWSGDSCGPRCQERRWQRHERWEARRQAWHHRRWEAHRYGYQAYPRY
jgi:hypothetical protein